MPVKYVPAVLQSITCRYCKVAFMPVSHRNVVCEGYECQRKRGREKLAAWKLRQSATCKPKRLMFCKVCLELQSKRVCSDECAILLNRYRTRVYSKSVVGTERSRAHTNTPVEKQCPECSIWFTVRTRIRKRRFCSRICSDRENKRDNQRLRRVRLKAKGPVKLTRIKGKEIAERDQWICQLCLKQVLPKYKYPHPMSASIDHIIPVSKGGGHEPINVQLAHFICNSTRGDTGPAQLRLLA